MSRKGAKHRHQPEESTPQQLLAADPQLPEATVGTVWMRVGKWFVDHLFATTITGIGVGLAIVFANRELTTPHLGASYSSTAAETSPIKRVEDQGTFGDSPSVVKVTPGQTASTTDSAPGNHPLRRIEFYVHNDRGTEALGVQVTVEAAGGFISIEPKSPLPDVIHQVPADGFTGGVRIDRLSVKDEVALVAEVLSVGPAPAQTLLADGVRIRVRCQNCDGVIELQPTP